MMVCGEINFLMDAHSRTFLNYVIEAAAVIIMIAKTTTTTMKKAKELIFRLKIKAKTVPCFLAFDSITFTVFFVS